MRTLVDIPNRELAELNVLSSLRNTSRAELIRQAVSGFLAQNKVALEDSFGLWKSRREDGSDYQHRLRGEWDR